MSNPQDDNFYFMKSLGFPALTVHHPFNHFDFKKPGRRILVIGPMGSGKTEFSARIWRDARVALTKSPEVARETTNDGADRRKVFFIRAAVDAQRFPHYPEDALAYRGGYERCGGNIAVIRDSFDLERLLEDHPEVGTWIIDEASFYDERMVYVIRNASEKRGLIFVYPTLILNFRKDIFNPVARLLLETSTDVFPLTAYCEHSHCLVDSYYTYRYYTVDEKECPALYFDPLIIIGGDTESDDPRQPNYCTRCDEHHYLPGKEYTFFTLKPLAVQGASGNPAPLRKELWAMKNDLESSELYKHFRRAYLEGLRPVPVNMNALLVPCLAERALVYLYAEQNILPEELLRELVNTLELDREYMMERLRDNRRPLDLNRELFDQGRNPEELPRKP